MILERQDRAGWGAKVIDRLAADLREASPDIKGFSPRNLKYMRAFAAAWAERAIVQEALAQIPWYHHIALLEKLDDPAKGLWYARQAMQHGWSHSILVLQINGRAHARQGKAITNFRDALRHLQRPIGVAGWATTLVERLPKALKGSLPTVKEIEAEVSGELRRTRKSRPSRARSSITPPTPTAAPAASPSPTCRACSIPGVRRAVRRARRRTRQRRS